MKISTPRDPTIKRSFLLSQVDPSSETQRRLAGRHDVVNRAAKSVLTKLYKNSQEIPWDATPNRPVPRPIRTLASDWPQKYFCGQWESSLLRSRRKKRLRRRLIRISHISHHFRDLLIRSSLLASSTVRLYCAVRAIARKLFSRSVSVKMQATKPNKIQKSSMLRNWHKIEYQLEKLDCGLMEGKFVNATSST